MSREQHRAVIWSYMQINEPEMNRTHVVTNIFGTTPLCFTFHDLFAGNDTKYSDDEIYKIFRYVLDDNQYPSRTC